MDESLSTAEEFLGQVTTAYRDLYAEIETGERAEHDLMPRLVRHLFVDALGYETTDYEQEDDWNDVRFYDSDRNPAVILEGKRRDVDPREGVAQVFEYASRTPYAEYLVVTNVDRLLLYRRCEESEADETHHGVSARLLADVNFEAVVNELDGSGLGDELDLDERQAIQQLLQIRRSEIHDSDRYDDFGVADRTRVDTDEGFAELVDTLSKCLDEYLMPYTLAAFDEYREQYEQFRERADDLQSQIDRLRSNNHDDSEIAELEVELAELRSENEPYREFNSDYETWVGLSQRRDEAFETNKEVFCRESVYVQLNKILLIRIAEDQGLTNQMISNGGVQRYFDFWDDFAEYTERDYADLFEFASEELAEVYDHLYTQQIFDWGLHDGAQLDDVLRRTMWHLNRFDFTEVSRDVLGHLYEEHLDPDERKAMGEFYTPTSVVDTILDRVGYTVDEPIETPEYDLLDPACGSGTFLVRAAARLRDRLDDKGVPPKDAIDILQNRLHGFDLNPFATHIAEMNLLFQVIDLYREVKADDESYTLDRFAVYQTDSLREDDPQTSLQVHDSTALQTRYREEKHAAFRAKDRDDFGFVVGNPPYVRIQNLPKGPARAAYDDYYSAYYNYDLYCLFVERAADWAAEDGRLGYVVSNKFLQSRYGERLREFVPTAFRLDTLIDFGSIDVFRSAKAFPLIMTATRLSDDGASRSPGDFDVPTYDFTMIEVSAESFPKLLESGAIRGWDDVDADPVEEPTDGGRARPTIPGLFDEVVPDGPDDDPTGYETVLADLGIDVDGPTEPPYEAFRVSSEMVSDSDWRFVSKREEEAMQAMEATGEPLKTYCVDENVERGLRTGDNGTFVLDRETIDSYGIEEELVHKLVGGKQVERWYSPWTDRYVLYTRKDTEIDDYPNAKAYLEERRDSLEDRWCVSEGGEPWYAIDKTKTPETFERPKIVTPDIVLYNNFWLDQSGEYYCLDTTYYLFSDDVDQWYLLGVLNSEPVQFFFRRTAPTYKDEFLRYKSDYVEQIPVADPDTADPDLVETVTETARRLQDRVTDYHDGDAVADDPTELYERRDVDTATLSLAMYVDRIGIDGDGTLGEVSVDGDTVHLNVDESVECRTEAAATAFARVVELLDPATTGALRDIALPRTPDALEAFLDGYDETAGALDEIEDDVIELESELNDAVYRLYDFDDDVREYVSETVETPTTPIRPKAMSDESE